MAMVAYNVPAQGLKTDSLKQLAETTTNDSVKISALLQLAFQYIFNDSKLAWQKITEARQLLERKNNPYLTTYATYVRAVYYDVTGSTDSARHYFENGLAESRNHGLADLEVKFLNGLGLNNWNRGYYQTALDLFLQVNEKNSKLEKSKQIPRSTPLNNIGLIYQELGLYDKALEFHNQALGLRLSDPSLLAQAATSYNNIGICLYHQKKYHEAEEAYRKGIELTRRHKFLRQYYDLASNLAKTLAALQRHEEAQRFNMEVLHHDSSIYLPDKFLMNVRSAAAGIYLDLGRPDQAFPLLQKCFDLIKQKPEYEFYASDVYRYASSYYYMTGNPQLGRYYADQQKEVVEQLFSRRNAESVAEMEVKYQTAEKERQILDQQLVIKQNNLLMAKQRNRNIVLTSAVVILVLLTITGLVYFRTRQKAREQQLLLQEKQLRLDAILAATEEERHRIARDLHDGIGQQLSGAILQLESAIHNGSSDMLKINLNPILDNLRITSSEVRALSHEMMPRSLTELGLVPAISDLLSRTFAHTPVHCTFHHHLPADRLDATTELALFRVVQELINNIIRHAHASQVAVNLLRIKDKLRLTVEDNGIGFDDAAVSSGHGIMNIRTRLEAIHGSILFERNGNEGTLVTVTLPLNT